MDRHSFSLLDPDPHSICESRFRSRGENIFKRKTEKFTKIGNNCKFIQIFEVNLHKLPGCLPYFLEIFSCFFQQKRTLQKVIFSNFVKLDPGLHLKCSWIRICIEKKCRIRKKWMRIHSSDFERFLSTWLVLDTFLNQYTVTVRIRITKLFSTPNLIYSMKKQSSTFDVDFWQNLI